MLPAVWQEHSAAGTIITRTCSESILRLVAASSWPCHLKAITSEPSSLRLADAGLLCMWQAGGAAQGALALASALSPLRLGLLVLLLLLPAGMLPAGGSSRKRTKGVATTLPLAGCSTRPLHMAATSSASVAPV